MATSADDPVFLDTNILVYANVVSAPLHLAALNHIQQLWDAGNPLWISRQVLREYAAVLTRPKHSASPNQRLSLPNEFAILSPVFKWPMKTPR